MVTLLQANHGVVCVQIVVQPDEGGGRIEICDGRLCDAVKLGTGWLRGRDWLYALSRVVTAARKEGDFVKHVCAIRLGGNRAGPPVNRGLRAVVVREEDRNDLCRALACAERAFGIAAIGGVVNVAGIDLELVAHLDPDGDRLP